MLRFVDTNAEGFNRKAARDELERLIGKNITRR